MDFRWTGVAVYQPAAAMLADPVAYCPPVDAEHGDAGRPAFGQRVAPGLRHDRQHDSDMRFDGAGKFRELCSLVGTVIDDTVLQVAVSGPEQVELQLAGGIQLLDLRDRSEEHTSELQSLMRISYAVFCLKKKK